MEKSSAPFSLGGEPIWNGILIRRNCFFLNVPITLLLVHWWTIVISQLERRVLLLIEIAFQIGSLAIDYGADLLPLIPSQFNTILGML